MTIFDLLSLLIDVIMKDLMIMIMIVISLKVLRLMKLLTKC